MTKKDNRSAAITLLDLVWNNANTATSHAYERLNHSMRNAVQLAIGAGFEFAEGDVSHIRNNYRSGYWIGESDEWLYSQAIQVGNMSVVRSYEAAKNRKAFIADDVSCLGYGEYTHGGGSWQRQRLAVGFSFPWKGLGLKVTSFAKDQSHVVACSYKKVKQGSGNYSYESDKVDKRFKITRDDILAERAERKERAKLLESLTKLASENGNAEKITRALGVKTHDGYARVPIEKIRKVAEKFGVRA